MSADATGAALERDLATRALVRLVRERSPFYRELYAHLPDDAALRDVPVLDQDEFWRANSLRDNRVLTGPMRDGIVFKSGGTTGSPKFSVFSKAEWRAVTRAAGWGMGRGILEAGDRVVNLFYVGQLYGSFLFVERQLDEMPVDVLHLPVGGATECEETARIVEEFAGNVLVGVPTTILNLAEFVASTRASAPVPGERRPLVTKILFAGEPFYPDQRERLGEIFPGVRIESIGYSSTDAGILGYTDGTCGPGEHRSYGRQTVLEILDEVTHEPIEDTEREGILVVTDLQRQLMPIVRYPVGDRARWLEPVPASPVADRKFALLGRSEEAARVGLIKLYVQEVQQALDGLRGDLGITGFQLTVVHRDRLDGLIVTIASGAAPGGLATLDALEARSADVVAAIHSQRPLYEEFVRGHKVHPIEVRWVAPGGLEVNARTGKLKRVIDRRL